MSQKVEPSPRKSCTKTSYLYSGSMLSSASLNRRIPVRAPVVSIVTDPSPNAFRKSVVFMASGQSHRPGSHTLRTSQSMSRLRMRGYLCLRAAAHEAACSSMPNPNSGTRSRLLIYARGTRLIEPWSGLNRVVNRKPLIVDQVRPSSARPYLHAHGDAANAEVRCSWRYICLQHTDMGSRMRLITSANEAPKALSSPRG